MTSVPEAYTASPIMAPSSTTRAMADLTGKFTNRLEDKPGDFRRKLISVSSAPVGDERAMLERRQRELRMSLVPTPGDGANGKIYLLIAGSPAFGMTERETDAKVLLYAEALRHQPTWAIERARQIFAGGGWKSAWNGRGCPSSAEVVSECRHVIEPIEAELYRIGQVLDAEVVDVSTTPQQRRDAIAGWEKLKAEIGRGNVMAERTPDEIARERKEMAEANRRFRDREAREIRAPSAATGDSGLAPLQAGETVAP